jgi:hypothetical protein
MSGPGHAALLPVAAMMLLVFCVGVALLAQRSREIRARRIHPQKVATSAQMGATMQRVNIADNFRNLFETPVLFYALCLSLAVTQSATPLMLAGLWAYVALRVVHSVIHCTYNRVMHRFAAFGAGFVLLLVLWMNFALGLLR